MEELTVQIQKPIIPPLVWNKEAVEAYVNEALEKYVGIVYTDDMIDDAKKDRAKLNALEKQLAKAFTATKDVYLGPLTELETVTKDLRQKIKKTSGENRHTGQILRGRTEAGQKERPLSCLHHRRWRAGRSRTVREDFQ